MKKVIVTGGSSGIGRAICIALAENKYDVTNLSNRANPKEGGPPVDKIPGVKTCLTDIRDFENLQLRIRKIDPDIIINNAGILPIKDFLSQTVDDYNNIMNTNLGHVIFSTQSAIKILIKKGGGVIINVASVAGYRASPDCPIYGASKAAIINFTQSIAGEYGRFGIRCNCICPGLVNTKLVYNGEPLPESELRKIPAGRVAEPSEIVNTVMWLLTADYVNGSCIVVDGGSTSGVWRWNNE